MLLLLVGLAAAPAQAQDSAADLAKKLANPVAAMISLPFQLNYDPNIGPDQNGSRWTLNVQPVVPFSLNQDWNLISRTIVPIVSQDEIFTGASSQSGLGDIVESAWFSPKQPTAGGWIWGAGPVLLLPTGTDDLLTAKKWGAGPTALALKQAGPWTPGVLVNHIWSFAGDGDRGDVSATFLQPFVTYTTPTAWSFALNIEGTYDWENTQWSVPLHVTASKVLKLGGQLASVAAGLRYWADGPASGPHDLGARVAVTLLFPK